MFFCVISLSRLFPISFVRSFVCFYCVVVAVVSLCFGAYCCSTRVGAAVAAIFLWRLSVCVRPSRCSQIHGHTGFHLLVLFYSLESKALKLYSVPFKV